MISFSIQVTQKNNHLEVDIGNETMIIPLSKLQDLTLVIESIRHSNDVLFNPTAANFGYILVLVATEEYYQRIYGALSALNTTIIPNTRYISVSTKLNYAMEVEPISEEEFNHLMTLWQCNATHYIGKSRFYQNTFYDKMLIKVEE